MIILEWIGREVEYHALNNPFELAALVIAVVTFAVLNY